MLAISVLAAARPGRSPGSAPGPVSSSTSQCGHSCGTRAAVSASTTAAQAPESASTYSISGGANRVLTRTAVAPASWTP